MSGGTEEDTQNAQKREAERGGEEREQEKEG